MPGPYAHITMLHELMQPGRLESFFPPASGINAALTSFFPYCVLGAVSPDYPNLARGNDSASQWADAMHCTRSGQMITSGIRHVGNRESAQRDKLLAWLLGYCAHVAADMTIHPVVQARVGVYAENQRQHRVCEMNQDIYIYRRMNLGEIGESNAFALTIAQCGTTSDRTRLDPDIVSLWGNMLMDIHPELFAANPPDISSWYREFSSLVSQCADSAVWLFPLAGVISEKMGLAYQHFGAVDRKFIEQQLVPAGCPRYLHYDDIFDHAVGNIAVMWRQVEKAVCAGDPAQIRTGEGWNMDTGRDAHDRLVFWE